MEVPTILQVMRLRRWLALLVAGTLVPVLAFSLAAVYQYGREQSAAADRALREAARALAVVLDKHIPVIILSADATPGQIERLLGAGARAFLTKPIDVRQLLAVLDEHMGTGLRHSAG